MRRDDEKILVRKHRADRIILEALGQAASQDSTLRPPKRRLFPFMWAFGYGG
jgi:hypothetical protein